MAEAFPVEVNGPANIVTLGAELRKLIILAQMGGNDHNVYVRNQLQKALKLAESIDQDAHHTIHYIQALGRGERPAWHQIKETRPHATPKKRPARVTDRQKRCPDCRHVMGKHEHACGLLLCLSEGCKCALTQPRLAGIRRDAAIKAEARAIRSSKGGSRRGN